MSIFKNYKVIDVQIPLKPILVVLLFLVFFQFFGSLFSTIDTSFRLNITLAFLTSAFFSYLFTREVTNTIITNTHQIILTFSTTIIFTILFLFRLNWGIADYICPTGLLGLVTQVSNGNFPVSFLSFPEFTMNYHQGFIYTAGVISYIFGLMPSISIKLTYLILYFLLNLTTIIFFHNLKSTYYLLSPFLFFLISSLSAKFYAGLDLSFYNYISIFEQSTSNSWPLTFLAFFSILFVIQNYTLSKSKISTISLLILSISTLNATLFNVLLLSFLIIFFYKIYIKQYLGWKLLISYILIFIFIYTVPKYIPSAFLVGEYYDTPRYAIKFIEMDFVKYIKQTIRYLFLSGPIIIIGILATYEVLLRKKFDVTTFLTANLIVSFFIPIVFIFTNIDMWDNIHKFAIINMFMSTLITLILINHKKYSKKIWVFIFLCITFSLPSTFDLLSNRIATNGTNDIRPGESISDIVLYLEKNKGLIEPYKIDIEEMCSETGYSAIAQFSGNFMKSSYFTNFLLSSDVENDYTEGLKVTDLQSSLDILGEDNMLIIDKKYGHERDITDFLENPAYNANYSIGDFKNYYLIKKI